MFEHLPVVSEVTMKACVENEAYEIAKDGEKCLGDLVVKNEHLAKAILMFAQVVAVKFEGNTKYRVEADTVIALLATLSLIDKELEKSAESI